MSGYWEENLIPASLGYVEIPIGNRTWSTGRNFARYTLPYRDGQGGEDLGRKVYVFNITVPLYRGMYAEGGEELYPDRYHQLIALIEDPDQRGEVEYFDPEFGLIPVKIVDYDASTPPDRRDGVELRIVLEELAFDSSALSNLARPKAASEAQAIEYATAADQDVTFTDGPQEDKPAFSLTETWRAFQASLDAGAQSADAVAARLDEVYFVAEKFANYSDKDELQRWSIFVSTVNMLGACEDIGDDRARNENAGTRLVAFVLPVEMSAYDIATAYHGDSSRAEEVIFNNQSTSPMSFPQGSTVMLNDDARAPGATAAANRAEPNAAARTRASAA
jgi:hypothetical protein